MFVLLLIEISRSLFDDLHLNCDDGKEDSSVIRAITRCAIVGALKFIHQAPLSLNLHVNPATSGVDINAFLRGGKADYHTGLI